MRLMEWLVVPHNLADDGSFGMQVLHGHLHAILDERAACCAPDGWLPCAVPQLELVLPGTGKDHPLPLVG